MGAPRTARAGDPYLRWFTLETPHFRIHFHGGLEALAQRTASIAERTHRHLIPELGWSPTEVTHIVLTDTSDSANGLATAIPYNAIVLLVTAPEDMSPLNDYDDWQLDLLTHEYTHILHIDNLSGLPSLINAVFGKVIAPNQAQPRWILEGLAVAMESRHSSAGRLVSTQFDMFLRADVLEGNIATLDEISNLPRRWPGGNLWYLYGAKFVEWIIDVYGPNTFGQVATHYGRSVIPWGINRAIRRATGLTYPELYVAWIRFLQARYAEFARQIRGRGLREGTRLTRHGRIAHAPRFVPAACRSGNVQELLYYRDDGADRAGLYLVPTRPLPKDPKQLVTPASRPNASYGSDCSLIFESVAPSRRGHYFSDLFRLPAGVRTSSGLSEQRERLTTGARAREPDVSPDGRRVVYVTNHAGTTTLRIAKLSASGITQSERLVPSARYEQVFTPRFSPDGTQVAYSVWSRGGFRDIRIIDLATRRVRQVTSDRALDQQPSFAPDGKTLYFTSDRSGVANVYAYELDTSALHQVTNVLTGAYMPAVSEDGRVLAYAGYTSQGFDLFSMPLDRSRFLSPPAASARPSGELAVPPQRWPVRPYSPLGTLGPRSYGVDVGTGMFGTAVALTTQGSDAVGHHAFLASLMFDTGAPSFQGALNYSFRRLPFDLHAGVFRGASPRDDYRLGETAERVIEDRLGITTGVSLFMPGEFDWQSAGFSYSMIDFAHETPLHSRADPWAPLPSTPHAGLLAALHLGYTYSNVQGSLYGVSLERGFSVSLGVDFAHPALGSEATLSAFNSRLTAYLPAPWHARHIFALALSQGASSGSYPRRGLYWTGGFVDQPALDVYTTGLQQSAFVLRGYTPGQFVGSEYTLLNAEYRFPLLYADRGVSTLPVFLRQISGAVFSDYGGAYYDLDPNQPLRDLHASVGAELWMELVLGYRIFGTLRLGIARGLSEQAPGIQTYFVAASAF